MLVLQSALVESTTVDETLRWLERAQSEGERHFPCNHVVLPPENDSRETNREQCLWPILILQQTNTCRWTLLDKTFYLLSLPSPPARLDETSSFSFHVSSSSVCFLFRFTLHRQKKKKRNTFDDSEMKSCMKRSLNGAGRALSMITLSYEINYQTN